MWKKIPPVSSCQRISQDMPLERKCLSRTGHVSSWHFEVARFPGLFCLFFRGYFTHAVPLSSPWSPYPRSFLAQNPSSLLSIPVRRTCGPFSSQQSSPLEVLFLFARSWARPHCHLSLARPTNHSSSHPRLVPQPGQRGGLLPFFLMGESGSLSSTPNVCSPRSGRTTTLDSVPPETWCRRRSFEGSDRRFRR